MFALFYPCDFGYATFNSSTFPSNTGGKVSLFNTTLRHIPHKINLSIYVLIYFNTIYFSILKIIIKEKLCMLTEHHTHVKRRGKVQLCLPRACNTFKVTS